MADNNAEILFDKEIIKKLILALTDSVNLEEVFYKIRQYDGEHKDD